MTLRDRLNRAAPLLKGASFIAGWFASRSGRFAPFAILVASGFIVSAIRERGWTRTERTRDGSLDLFGSTYSSVWMLFGGIVLLVDSLVTIAR
jgi:hypothetical protein